MKFLKAYMTYEKAQTIYKTRHGRTIKICWIANVKKKYKATKRQTLKRIGIKPKYPCPVDIFSNLEKIFKELHMI